MQHIYSFNGCCDALGMHHPEGGRIFSLTASFRLGPEVAHVANLILNKRLDENRRVSLFCMTHSHLHSYI